jgi:dTDP-4-dehydrorhamnose reductase
MRCVVTGSAGQLGRCLAGRLEASGRHELAYAAGRDTFDVADEACVEALFEEGCGEGADVLFNAAAYTAVDRCERETARAREVNAVGAMRLARRCRERGVLLVHVSTDYVFAGDAHEPYQELDPTSPVNAYGRTKLEGEQGVQAADPRALVVRTSWVFGPGRNFVAAILEQARKRRTGEAQGPLAVVDDQVGSPTYAGHLADGLVALAELALAAGPADAGGDALDPAAVPPVHGLYHLAGAGSATWWEFARRILDRTGHADLEIDRMKTASLDLPAARPAFSVLDTRRAAALGVELPAWEQGLDDYLASPDGEALWEGQA